MSLLERLDETELESLAGDARVTSSIDPLRDPRWDEFVLRHPQASVFHCSAWLEALSRTYGYKPIAYTTSPAGQVLHNGWVFCQVESWLTGRRLVSLPFSDHCQPLVEDCNDFRVLGTRLQQAIREGEWCYIEMRPLLPNAFLSANCQTSATYYFHQLDLTPDLATIFDNLHKDSIRRKILRAERERLTYQEGATDFLLDEFYQLLAVTRRRHRVPPQPKEWLYNLRNCFGEALKVRIARKNSRPVAGMLTLQFKDTLYYKYGGSEARFNRLGGMHLLYWKSIQHAKSRRLRSFDLGRTDTNQPGLIRYKNRWGTIRTRISYFRYSDSGASSHIFEGSDIVGKMRFLKWGFAHAPLGVLCLLGRLLYKHVG